jgi:CHAD domain-containing protein
MKTSADKSYQLLAARYLRKQARQLREQLDGVRVAEDIEFVHRARVASRRLRAAMGMFDGCFPGKKMKKWRKQIKAVTEGLGGARDKDVQIDYLQGVLCHLEDKSHYCGIARLMVQTDDERQRLQPTVNETVDGLESSGVLDEMEAVTDEIIAAAKKKKTDIKSLDVFRRARQHILDRLAEVLPLQACLTDAQAKEEHHAMRIAAKRLRYTVEIARPVYNSQLDEVISAVKQVQTYLGDIHDCDVWVDHLQEYLRQERRRILAAFGHAALYKRVKVGIKHLQQARRTQREKLFAELVQCWDQLHESGLWEDLVRTISKPVEVDEDGKDKQGAEDAVQLVLQLVRDWRNLNGRVRSVAEAERASPNGEEAESSRVPKAARQVVH